jgi:hypothetical protein
MLLALGSIASSQSGTLDEALSPIEILTQAATAPPTTASPPGGGDKTDAKPDTVKKPDATKPAERAVDPLTQCLRDWDAGTHMTRQEWARTCRRVVSNRLKFLGEQQGSKASSPVR